MAEIRRYPLYSQLRSDAGSHVVRHRNGRVVQSRRGLVCWFSPEQASIAEIPMADREMTLFVKGRTKDFQEVAAQGAVTWRVVDPEVLAKRIDFSIHLVHGRHLGQPIEQIEARLTGLTGQAALQFMAERTIRELLDGGFAPMRAQLEAALQLATQLHEIGIEAVSVRLTALTPSSELERALQTPTFEALQQKADQAMFERRALAVEKERAIAENELATKTELARREKNLISEEATNARNRALGLAEASQIQASAEAERIRIVDAARAEAEQAHIAVYRDINPSVLLGLAGRELAGKLEKIEHLNVTPDLLATIVGEFRKPADRRG